MVRSDVDFLVKRELGPFPLRLGEAHVTRLHLVIFQNSKHEMMIGYGYDFDVSEISRRNGDLVPDTHG